MDRRIGAGWARIAAFLAASLSGLYLLAVLGFGYVWITTDWSAWACFDRDEPACTAPRPSDTGLSAVQTSSWVRGSVAGMASLAALVLVVRVRRIVDLAAVVALCAINVVIGQALWARL